MFRNNTGTSAITVVFNCCVETTSVVLIFQALGSAEKNPDSILATTVIFLAACSACGSCNKMLRDKRHLWYWKKGRCWTIHEIPAIMSQWQNWRKDCCRKQTVLCKIRLCVGRRWSAETCVGTKEVCCKFRFLESPSLKCCPLLIIPSNPYKICCDFCSFRLCFRVPQWSNGSTSTTCSNHLYHQTV